MPGSGTTRPALSTVTRSTRVVGSAMSSRHCVAGQRAVAGQLARRVAAAVGGGLRHEQLHPQPARRAGRGAAEHQVTQGVGTFLVHRAVVVELLGQFGQPGIHGLGIDRGVGRPDAGHPVRQRRTTHPALRLRLREPFLGLADSRSARPRAAPRRGTGCTSAPAPARAPPLRPSRSPSASRCVVSSAAMLTCASLISPASCSSSSRGNCSTSRVACISRVFA